MAVNFVTQAQRDKLVELYVGYFNRAPEAAGLNFWSAKLLDGINSGKTEAATLTGIANQFYDAGVQYNIFGAAQPVTDFIKVAYANALGRTSVDDPGMAYWTAKLVSGAVSRGEFVQQLIKEANAFKGDATWGWVATYMENRVAVANKFADNSDNITGQAAITAGTSALSVVTPATAQAGQTVAQALAAAEAAGVVGGGSIFTLTTGADNIVGTAGNEIVNGYVNYATAATGSATSTLTAADVIKAAAGTDTLNITVDGILKNTAGANVSLPAADISGVEVLNVRNLTTSDTTELLSINASTISGLTAVNSDRSTSKLVVTGLAAGASAGITGNGTVTNGNLDFAYATPTGAAILNISGGTKGTAAIANTGTGATSFTINSTGAANTVGTIALAATATVTALTINAATDLTTGAISGVAANATLTASGAAAKVSVGALDANFKTVDASGLTAGGLTATVNGAAVATFTLKGGAGNDTITNATLANVVTAGAIDAGAGTGDKLIIASSITTAAQGAVYANFETLQNAAAATQDVSLVAGITAVELNANGAGFSNLSATQAAAVTNLQNNASATLALKDATGTADVLTVTLKNATANASASLTNATVNGFETLNVVSSSGDATGTTSSVGFAAAANLTAINVSGANKLSLSLANTAKAVTVASTQTGTAALDVSGLAIKGSVITTTANADAITATGAVAGTTGDFVTYNAGAGNDTINTTLAAINNTSAATASLKIDGGAGVDTLNTDIGTYNDASFQFITNVEKISFGTAGGTITGTTGGFFDTNFKTAGIDLSGTFGTVSTGASGVVSIDATSFTGNLTETWTQFAAGAVADAFTLKSGSGNDTIAVTTNAALTSVNTITTGAGNDKVTVTAAELGTGTITVSTGSGNDTITTLGVGKIAINAGTGADAINLFANHTGVASLTQVAGDSGTFAKPAANSIVTTSFDVVKGALASDTINFSNANLAAVVTGIDLTAAALTFANDTLTQIRGNYDAVANTFVGSATGTDSLVVVDTTAGAVVTLESVVLVGVTTAATIAAGTITFA